MLDIERVYSDFIDSHKDDHLRKYEDYDGWFGASSAGNCFKKQYYKHLKLEPKGFDNRVARLLRLGTIFHEDIAKSIKYHIKNRDSTSPHSESKLYVEKQVKIPSLKVLGHVDILEQEDGISRVFDMKTVSAYRWRKKFGRTTKTFRPDPNLVEFYKMQVGTYALALTDSSDSVEMYLCWYNKDNSQMKPPIEVESYYIDKANNYWEKLWEFIESYENPEDMIPGVIEGVPMDEEWECNYCSYNDICNSKFNTKKR